MGAGFRIRTFQIRIIWIKVGIQKKNYILSEHFCKIWFWINVDFLTASFIKKKLVFLLFRKNVKEMEADDFFERSSYFSILFMSWLILTPISEILK